MTRIIHDIGHGQQDEICITTPYFKSLTLFSYLKFIYSIFVICRTRDAAYLTIVGAKTSENLGIGLVRDLCIDTAPFYGNRAAGSGGTGVL